MTGEEDISERVIEDNDNGNFLYCGGGIVRGKVGFERTSIDGDFLEDCDRF